MGSKNCKLNSNPTQDINSTFKNGDQNNRQITIIAAADVNESTKETDSPIGSSIKNPFFPADPYPVSILSVKLNDATVLNRKKSEPKGVRFSEKAFTVDYYTPNNEQLSKQPSVFIKICSGRPIR
jgi:hypothetical protein